MTEKILLFPANIVTSGWKYLLWGTKTLILLTYYCMVVIFLKSLYAHQLFFADTFYKRTVKTDSIHTRSTRNKHQVYSKKDNRAIGKRQLKCQPSKTLNSYPIYMKTTQTRSQFKTAFYKWKLDGYSSGTLNFAPNMFWLTMSDTTEHNLTFFPLSLPSTNKFYLLSISLNMAQLLFAMRAFFSFC